MATYIERIGEVHIPEDKRDQYKEDVYQILNQGGMMRIDKVEIYGMTVGLLIAPRGIATSSYTGEKYHYLNGNYNFFEGECWPHVGLSLDKFKICSDKVGWNIVNCVASALYMLESLYDPSVKPDLAGASNSADSIVAWINEILNKDYPTSEYYNVWNMYDFIKRHQTNREVRFRDVSRYYHSDTNSDTNGLLSYFAVEYGFDNAFEQLTKQMIIDYDFKEFCRQEYHFLKNSYQKFREEHPDMTDEDILEMMIKIKGYGTDVETFMTEVPRKDKWMDLFFSAVFLRADPLVFKFLSEHMNFDFWDFWDQYKYKERWDKRKIVGVEEEVKRMSTEDFLEVDRKNRLLWLSAEEVKNTKALVVEILDWKRELDSIKESVENNASIVLKDLMETLNRLHENYRQPITHYGIYMFRETFYEMLSHSEDINWIVAYELLKRLESRNQELWLKEHEEERSWYKPYFEESKWEINRYLMLLANKEVRTTYFGF